ncbi:MAG: hypothetical protein ACHQPI_10555 [Thermoanaerobaculia bacterium]
MSKARSPRVLVVLLLVLASAGTALPALADEPFGPIHMAANRSSYTGSGCPIEILYTATINFTMPHPKGFAFNYHWERSDGAKTPVQVVRPSPNQRSMVLRDKWKLGSPGRQYDASVTLFVNSGNTHESHPSPSVRVVCR